MMCVKCLRGWTIVCILLLLTCVACVTRPVTLATWKDPNYRAQSVGRILIVGVAKQEIYRRIFEERFVNVLQKYNVNALASYQHLAQEIIHDEKTVTAKVKELGVDSVLVARKVNARREEIIHPEEIRIEPDYLYGYNPPYPYYYHGWQSYYSQSYRVINYPAYTEKYDVFTLETNLYDAKTDKLVWASTTELWVTGQENIERLIDDFIQSVVKNLAKEEIIKVR